MAQLADRGAQTLRRDHSPFRGQLAKARRAIRNCAKLQREVWEFAGAKTQDGIPESAWRRRMLWHRAWEEYGNKLGKELIKNGGINSPIHDDMLVDTFVEGKWYEEAVALPYTETVQRSEGEGRGT